LAGLIASTGELHVADHDPRLVSAETAARSRAYCAQKPTCALDYRVGDLGEIVGDSESFAALAEPYGGVLLLDEPAAALDLSRREAVRRAIRSFAQAGAACMVATHDLGFARECDQVIVLAEGRMVASGRPADVLTPEVIASVWGEGSSPAA
jgi:ABC-type cobalamin transport system ATPase subunit